MSHDYMAVWDVLPDANMFRLVAEAQVQFPQMAATDGVLITGPVRFYRERADRFVAVAAAERDPHAGRLPPWESKDEYRTDLIDPAMAFGEVA